MHCLKCGKWNHENYPVCECTTQGGGELPKSDGDDDTDYKDRQIITTNPTTFKFLAQAA